MSETKRSRKKVVTYGMLTVALMPLILPMAAVRLAWVLAEAMMDMVVDAW